MINNFRIVALPKKLFTSLLKLNANQLNAFNAKWLTVDSNPGYPCRVSLQDAEIGEKVLALSYTFHNVESPYKASGPIFIREMANTAELEINHIPKMLSNRHLSVRAYNEKSMIVDAVDVMGRNLRDMIQKLFSNKQTAYLHIHNAKPGCFNCSVLRV